MLINLIFSSCISWKYAIYKCWKIVYFSIDKWKNPYLQIFKNRMFSSWLFILLNILYLWIWHFCHLSSFVYTVTFCQFSKMISVFVVSQLLELSFSIVRNVIKFDMSLFIWHVTLKTTCHFRNDMSLWKWHVTFVIFFLTP